MTSERSTDRRNGAERLAIAGGLFAAASATPKLRVRGARPLGQVARDAWRTRSKPEDASRSAVVAAGKFAARRGMQVAAIPLAYHGARDVVQPGGGRGRAQLHRDVVKPVVDGATGRDMLRRHQQRWQDAAVTKSNAGLELTTADRKKLIRRKRQAVGIAIGSGTLGVAAGAARAPQILRAGARVAPKVSQGRVARRVIAAEPKFTQASNTLGVASIATGSAGAFNAAAVQRREARALAKSARYMRDHADRVSPQAEDAYHRLRGDRNAGYGGAILNGTAAAAGVDYTREAFKAGRKGWGGLGVAMTAASGIAARNSYAGARRKQRRMDKIEAKAKARARAGLYGPGRGKDPVDPTSARANLVAKAGVLGAAGIRPAEFGRAIPKGVVRPPRPRAGTIRRVPGGGAVSVRGSLG